ncbi:MAG TPA: imidazole glycerol phosphate synthase subunit HisH [Candidatus Limnocylindrales bacterium]|nr:imidazole glycerol phosphate synthase subunit HisH [Candidatus Limnocylindrales bacterium]
MPSLVIVDSGSANLNSIYKALQIVSLQSVISDNPPVIASADAVIFPGVGSFEYAAALLERKGLSEVLLEVIAAGKPFLGICLGMQLLFSSSTESSSLTGNSSGLNVVHGLVKRFPCNLHVPHVGWNQVNLCFDHPLFDGLSDGAYFYFTHSYYAQPDLESHTLALTEYGFPFTSATVVNSLCGVQFHPEKSGPAGLRLLSNFGKIIADL